MNINCSCIDNKIGGLIFFVKSSFNKENIEDRLKENFFIYSGIVLLEDTDTKIIVELLKEILKFNLKVDLCLCHSSTETYINELLNLKKSYNLRSIIVSMNNFYKLKIYDGIKIGLEKWSNGISVDLLTEFDTPTIRLDDVKRLEPYAFNVVEWIIKQNPKNNLEKIVLFDYWIQENIQYIKSRESNLLDKIYVCETMDRDSRVEDVLLNHFGCCEDISFTATLVLNHPAIGIECRQVSSKKLNHSWNIISYNSKDYFCDFTRNITRNPCKIPGALKARSYSPIYTLLGKKDITSDYEISDYYDCSNIAEISCDRNLILHTAETLFMDCSLTFPDKLIVDSYLVRK